MSFTWWGGIVGPKILSHVKCADCNKEFNGKSGKDNTTGIIIYSIVALIIIGGLIVLLVAAFLILMVALNS